MISALLLAAGASRRFGAPKLLQHLNGKPVIRWSAEALGGANADEIVVVVPPEHADLRRALAGLNARFVVNANAEQGMGTSLAAGVAALSADSEAVIVALADEPVLDRHALRRVVARYREGGVSIVAPTYGGVRGHPVLFGRGVWDELRTLTGDRGARDVVDREAARVAFVEMDVARPIDVDTPEDFARLQASAAQTRTLLDEYMPEYHVRASYGTDVGAPAADVYRALLETNLADSPVARALMFIRSLGRRSVGSAFRFGALPARGAFFELGRDPPREVVAGVVGRFWSLTSNVADSDPQSFRGPIPPGTAKAGWNFCVEPTATGSWLTTETRVLCADEQSRRSFLRYWKVVGPFSGVIRLEALRLIRRRAQYMSPTTSQLP